MGSTPTLGTWLCGEIGIHDRLKIYCPKGVWVRPPPKPFSTVPLIHMKSQPRSSYIIFSEYVYEDGESSFHYLIDWDRSKEDSTWSTEYHDSSSVMSFIDCIIKEKDLETPIVFETKKEAKEVVEIIKAYDDPNDLKRERVAEVNYYLVFAKTLTKTFLARMIDLEEV